MPPPWCSPNQAHTIHNCHWYLEQYSLSCLWIKKISGSESGSRPGSAMSSAPSEGGGARSKEVSKLSLLNFFCIFSPMLPICYILHSLLATCKAKREARDGNIKEGAKEGSKERGSKERGAQEERCVSRGENYLAEKKTRLR